MSIGNISGITGIIPEQGGGSGGGLSPSDQIKLDSIQTGAEVNIAPDWNAVAGDAQILNKPILGTAAAQDTTAFATSAQGTLAGTALQPGVLPAGTTIPLGQVTGAGTAAASNSSDFATTSQGTLADTSLQPGVLPAGTTIPVAQVTGVGTAATANSIDFATALQGTLADTSLQPSSNIPLARITGAGTAAAADSNAFATAAQGVKADTALQSVANATTTVAGLMSPAYVNKVDGIASGATANSTDADLRDRTTHTGVQLASTISDFSTSADARITLQKGAVSGIATLDATGTLIDAQIPTSLLSGLKWQGVWDVAGNSPIIPPATTLNNGHLYRVSVAGTSVITGASVSYTIGDWLISNGSVWQRTANTLESATQITQGIIQLTGDLSGLATAPIVSKLRGVAVPTVAPTAGQVYVALTPTTAEWQTLGAQIATPLDYAYIEDQNTTPVTAAIQTISTLTADNVVAGTVSRISLSNLRTATLGGIQVVGDQLVISKTGRYSLVGEFSCDYTNAGYIPSIQLILNRSSILTKGTTRAAAGIHQAYPIVWYGMLNAGDVLDFCGALHSAYNASTLSIYNFAVSLQQVPTDTVIPASSALPASSAPPTSIEASVGVSTDYARADHAHDIDFYIGTSAPAKSGPLLWVQTGMGGGSDFTFWIQD